MKVHERIRSLLRSPWTFYRVLLRGRYDFTYDLMPVQVRGMSTHKRINLTLSGQHLVYRHLRPANWPLHIQLELTNYCNLHCPVCPTGSGALARPPLDMDLGLFERVWNEIGPYLLTASLWGWGEPLLHPQLRDILRIASTQPVATLLSTNGQRLDRPDVQQALVDYPPTYLIVCIDGLTDETNQVYRRGARLQLALEGVKRIAAAKRERNLTFPILHMRYIVMRHNEHELPDIERFARDAEFDLLTIRTLSTTDSTDAAYPQFVPVASDWNAYEYEAGQRIRRHDYVCQQPFWFPALYSDGTLVPCDQDSQARLPFGVITPQRSFADVWFGRDSARVRRIVRDTPETLDICPNCPFADRPAEACSVRAVALRGPVMAQIGPLPGFHQQGQPGL